jgi:hypothetical protein
MQDGTVHSMKMLKPLRAETRVWHFTVHLQSISQTHRTYTYGSDPSPQKSFYVQYARHKSCNNVVSVDYKLSILWMRTQRIPVSATAEDLKICIFT